MVASQLVTQEMHFPQSKVAGAQPAQARWGEEAVVPSTITILS